MLAGRKLLIVDSSVAIRKIVELTFADEGVVVTTAATGEEAVEKLDTEDTPTDIVLAHVSVIGRWNGYRLCDHIKSDWRFQHIPVLLLVGTFEPFNEAEARRVGADGVLTKPFQSIRDLVNKVGALLSGRAEEKRDDATVSQIASEGALSPASLDRTEEFVVPSSGTTAAIDAPTSFNEHPSVAVEQPIKEIADVGSADDRMIEVTSARQSPAVASDTREHERLDSNENQPFTLTAHDESGFLAATLNDNEQPPASATSLDSPSDEAMVLQTEHETIADDDGIEPNNIEPSHTRRSDELFMSEPEIPDFFTAGETSESMTNAKFSNRPDAAATDDTLLDLGDIEPPAASVDEDDFVLDLMDDSPSVPASAHDAGYSNEDTIEMPTSFGEGIETPSFDSSTSPSPISLIDETAYTKASPFDESTAHSAPSIAAASFASSTRTGVSDFTTAPLQNSLSETIPAAASNILGGEEGQITLDQLSPAVIDAIARRAVEYLSEQVVREIAWEVVPQLAELMIKRRLEEEDLRKR